MEKEFLNASSEIGNNFTLIQGAGGNTSYKSGKSLFVKASGFKLKNALKEDIFVEVNLNLILDNLSKGKSDPLQDSWDKRKNIKPSIETTMHAVLPQKYIFHIHCLNSLSWLVRNDYEKEFSNIFKDYKYCIIRYLKPGLSITKEIEKIKKKFIPDIIFLENHGVVIGSNKIKKALDLIYFVSSALNKSITFKYKLNKNIIYKSFNIKNFRPIRYKKAHSLAYSFNNINILSLGSLYPDQVVYLGTNPFLIINDKEINLLNHLDLKKTNYPKIIIIRNIGVFVPIFISKEAEELVLALSIIISKIPKDSNINFLNKNQENALINWDAEIYRFNLNKN